MLSIEIAFIINKMYIKNKITVRNEYFKNELRLLKCPQPLIFRYIESLHKKIILHYSKIYYLFDTLL
jgi:hypothetical protein